MTQEKDDTPEDPKPTELTAEEKEAERERKIKERIEELRKRDPFIYR